MSTSWLRRRALEVASLLHTTVLGLDYDQDEINQMALRIEPAMREFAERTTNALRLRLPCTHYLRSGDAYRAAITEADKGDK